MKTLLPKASLFPIALLAGAALTGCLGDPEPESRNPAAGEENTLAVAAQAIGTSEVTGSRINFSSTQKIPYFRNVALNDIPGRTDISRAIVMVHGSGRDAGTMYDRVMDACGGPCNPSSSSFNTLVIVPSFLTKEDVDTRYNGDANLLYWTESSWKVGYKSENTNEMSSFEVMERIVRIIKDKMGTRPLKLHLAGHSAGGQFMNRYAALSPDSPFPFTRYFVLAPSSYLYFTSKRINDAGNEFTPGSSANCSDYDEYRYGVSNIGDLGYAQDNPFQLSKYTSRRVINLVGTEDVTDASLDQGCEANLQGDERVDRARRYKIHVDKLPGSNRNVFLSIEGEGHPSRPLLESPEAGSTLFNWNPDSQIPWGNWQTCDRIFGTGGDFCLFPD